MQKIFIRWFSIIMVITVLLTVACNSLIQADFAERSAVASGNKTIGDIAERIDSNQAVIKDLTASLDENYIARAKAFAEIIAQSPDMIYDFDEMVRIAKVLNVDEVHVIDEKGILRWGNNPVYYEYDFSTSEQTRPFLPGLTDKNFEIAQVPQRNGSIGRLFQYIGVARQDKPGIVQVGIVPEVLDRALANNKIDVVVANFNIPQGETVIAMDKSTGVIVADSNRQFIGKNYADIGIPQENFSLEKSNGWIQLDGQRVFTVYDTYADYIIAVSFAAENLSAERWSQNVVAVVSSTLLGLIIIAAIFILLKKRIISDIDAVNRDLKRITKGDLDIVVSANATPEFAQLSRGINEMVESLKNNISEIASQASKLEENNKDILSSLHYARRIQNNLLPSPGAFQRAFQDYSVLWEPKDVVGGDIYWIKNFEQGSVLCVCDCTGHGTPGALLTMLVVTALEAVVTPQNYKNPDVILWELDQTLVSTLNATDGATDISDGADLAVLFINKSGEIVLASANTHLFICNGEITQDIKGQKISLGDGTLTSCEDITTVTIAADEHNKYYVASDGLFHQIGGKSSIPFGYRRFKEIVLENHSLTQQEILDKVWEEFKLHMGVENRRDDVTLLSFQLYKKGEC